MVHLQRDGVAAVVAHDALRAGRSCPRCTGCRAGRWRRPARSRPARRRRRARPSRRSRPATSGARQPAGRCRITQRSRLVRRERDRRVEQRLVLDDALGLDAARRRHDRRAAARRRCASPARAAAKPPNTTEWIAPSRAQASMREHGLGHHRHVDHDAVAAGRRRARASAPAKRATSSLQLARSV